MAKTTINSSKRKPREKKLSRFSQALIIYIITLSLLIISGICVLCGFLYTYETNLPEKTAQKYVSSLDENKLAELIESTLEDISELESSSLLLARSEHLSHEITQMKYAKEYTSMRPVYRLICGEHDIGKLTLRKSAKDAPFGLSRWEIDEVELYHEAIAGAGEKKSYTVCVPDGASLEVNGKEAGTDLLSESAVKYTGKSVLTQSDTLCDVYVLDGLYTKPDIEASYLGQKSSVNFDGSDADWFTQSERCFIMTVPEEATLTVNGKTPEVSFSTKGELTQGVSTFEKELGDRLPKAVSYFVFGTKADADISVSVHGRELSGEWVKDENGYDKVIYLYSEESKYRINAILPEGAVLYINGIEVGKEYLKGSAPFGISERLSYLSKEPEKLFGTLYEVEGLLCRPEIKATLGDIDLPICSYTESNLLICAEFYGKPDATLKNSFSSYAESYANSYISYVSNGAVGIEENISALLAQMKNGSPGYKQIQKSKSSFEFVNQATYKIDRLETLNFIPLGENLFFCQTDFSVTLRYYRTEKLYTGTLSLIFVKEEGGAKVSDLIIDGSQEDKQ